MKSLAGKVFTVESKATLHFAGSFLGLGVMIFQPPRIPSQLELQGTPGREGLLQGSLLSDFLLGLDLSGFTRIGNEWQEAAWE